MDSLASTIRTEIGNLEKWQAIDVRAIADGLRASFPDRSSEEILKRVVDIAIREGTRAVFWGRSPT